MTGRRWLHLASNQLFREPGDRRGYECNVDVSVEPAPARVQVGEGIGFHFHRATLSLEEGLDAHKRS